MVTWYFRTSGLRVMIDFMFWLPRCSPKTLKLVYTVNAQPRIAKINRRKTRLDKNIKNRTKKVVANSMRKEVEKM